MLNGLKSYWIITNADIYDSKHMNEYALFGREDEADLKSMIALELLWKLRFDRWYSTMVHAIQICPTILPTMAIIQHQKYSNCNMWWSIVMK